MGGKTCNIAIQFGLQQFCKTSRTFFVARFTAALALFCIRLSLSLIILFTNVQNKNIYTYIKVQ